MLCCPNCRAPLKPLCHIAADMIPSDPDKAISLETLRKQVYGDQPRDRCTVYNLMLDAGYVLRKRGRILRKNKIREGRSFRVYYWHEPFKLALRVAN